MQGEILHGGVGLGDKWMMGEAVKPPREQEIMMPRGR